jgi:hypothetical protein
VLAPLIESMPGIGTLPGAEFLAATGGIAFFATGPRRQLRRRLATHPGIPAHLLT